MKNHEQRKEPRVRSRGHVNLLAGGADAVSGTIHDVSPSGISVVAESEISIGTLVRIEGAGFTGHGVVRYCSRQGQGYRVGVALGPAAAI
jgi:hypothetical protein